MAVKFALIQVKLEELLFRQEFISRNASEINGQRNHYLPLQLMDSCTLGRIFFFLTFQFLFHLIKSIDFPIHSLSFIA